MYVLSKPKGKPPAQTRMCIHCGQTKPLSNFYSNKDWVENNGKDAWCKQCIAKIRTKDEMRRYFWENNRMWKENVWENALKQAELQAAKSTVYQKSNEERRQVLLESIACPIMPQLFKLTQNYKYEEHKKDVNANNYDEAKETGKIVEFESSKAKDKNLKVYNEFFNGEFKPVEIEYLENYYKGLEADFDLSDTSLRDNAKKLAKASLLADKVQNDYMAGRCSLQDVKDAMTQYDLLMKTGNFAACKRKPGDKAGLGSWAEIAFQLESTGHIMQRKIEWEKDDVDKTIEEFRYIVESLGLDTI
ncbi:MAG: hypothetical protein J6Y78_15540 [Paludibacteraceae bacterium]|nr:hypothetical protein [Paludibacteraceae bacterium]